MFLHSPHCSIQKSLTLIAFIMLGVMGSSHSAFASEQTMIMNMYLPPVSRIENPLSEFQKRIESIDSLDSLDAILTPISVAETAFPRGDCPSPNVENLVNTYTDIDQNIPLQYINSSTGVDPMFTPTGLVDISGSITTLKNKSICMTGVAANALLTMSEVMKLSQLKIVVVSGYRSYDSQTKLYEKYADLNTKNKYPRVAPPGNSEHQLGTVVDVAGELMSGSDFAKTAEGQWINDHAHEYGFILSYPKGGEAKTGYMYEPWHLRYVGIENAKILHGEKYTLAYKPKYYRQSYLDIILKSLKKKISELAFGEQIGG